MNAKRTARVPRYKKPSTAAPSPSSRRGRPSYLTDDQWTIAVAKLNLGKNLREIHDDFRVHASLASFKHGLAIWMAKHPQIVTSLKNEATS